MLPEIKYVARDTFVFNAPSRRAKNTARNAGLHWSDLWPPNSPGLNPVHYKVWGVMQQRVYECRVIYEQYIGELKQRLVEVWNSVQHY